MLIKKQKTHHSLYIEILTISMDGKCGKNCLWMLLNELEKIYLKLLNASSKNMVYKVILDIFSKFIFWGFWMLHIDLQILPEKM